MADGCGLEGACVCGFGAIGYLSHQHPQLCARLMAAAVVGFKLASAYFLYSGIRDLVPYEIGNACWKQSIRDFPLSHEGYDHCQNASFRDGQPVLLGCWIRNNEVPPIPGWGPFANKTTATYGLRMQVSRKQCVEVNSFKSMVRHELGFSPNYVDMSSFKDYETAVQRCGVTSNPPWHSDIPTDHKEFVHGRIRVGAFTTEIPITGVLDELLHDPDWRAPGWRREDKHFLSMAWRVEGRNDGLGDVSMSIYRNRYIRHQEQEKSGRRMVPQVLLVLAGQNQGGNIVPWTSPWPCNVEAKAAVLAGNHNSWGFTREGGLENDDQYVLEDEVFGHSEFLNHTHLVGWGERRSGELFLRRFMAFCYIWFAAWLAFLCSNDVHPMSDTMDCRGGEEHCICPAAAAGIPATAAALPFIIFLVLGLHLLVYLPLGGYGLLGVCALMQLVIFVILLRASASYWLSAVWRSAGKKEAMEELLKESRSSDMEDGECSKESVPPQQLLR
mmetsp:Transcript_75406/g.140672  ORF Transcript_75406/g.140672 Transcript_75406/m.140672 type:complete len:499 (+) Transcript_75406:93-1589(+)